MGVSLSVFKLINAEKQKLLKKTVSTQTQMTFADLNLTDELGTAKSELRFVNYDKDKDRITYRANHFSDTINRAVRVFLESIEESFGEVKPRSTQIVNNGYQEVYAFDVVIDFKNAEIFVFTKKVIAIALMKRFKRNGLLDYAYIRFDLAKIDELPELDNVWGVWEDSQGRCKKKAYFGTEVHKEEGIDHNKITSYNIEYEYDSQFIDLFISAHARISSKSSFLKNVDLFKIYSYLKTGLSATTITETFQEQD